MELTLSMALAAIVCSISYASLNIISRSYRSFKEKNEQVLVLNRLDELLKKDIQQAVTLRSDSTHIIFAGQVRSVDYEFNKDYVTRTYLVTDTFKFPVSEFKISFNNGPPQIADTGSHAVLIDDLTFALAPSNAKISFHYKKKYSSVNLVKSLPHAIN